MENSISPITVTRPTPPVEATGRSRLEEARQASVDEAEASTQAERPSAENVAAAVEKINDFIQITRRDLQFSVDDETGRTVVKVLDSETDEVIRQIPAEEILTIAANLDEVRGLLFKAKA